MILNLEIDIILSVNTNLIGNILLLELDLKDSILDIKS